MYKSVWLPQKKSNTSLAIIEFLDYVYSSLDNKQSSIAVYPDFSKAFDTVNHDILMSKLLHNGIRGVMQSWFKSYLSNRKHYVSVKNCSSSMSNITLGVSQGSVLGPVIFIWYIDDMHRSSHQMHFVHFPDGTTVFSSGSDINNVHTTVNSELVGVDNLLKTNILSLNVSRCSYMIISNKNAFDINIRESILTKVSTVKFFGVTLDENLSFNAHVNKVTSKISKSVGVMRRLHCQLPANVMAKLNYFLVYSHLTYASLSWGRSGRLMLLRLSVLTGEHANYSQIITKIYSIFTLFMITLLSTQIP